MDPTIFGRLRLLWEWYNWGVFVAFVLALGAVFWVFFDTQRRGRESILWKVIAVVSLILIVPSVILRIDPTLALNIVRAVEPLAYLGLAAAVAALVTLFAYSLGVAVQPPAGRTCPSCGRELDPSWDHCPYCEGPGVTISEPLTDPGPILEGTIPIPDPVKLPPDPTPYDPRPKQDPTVLMKRGSPQLAWLIQFSEPRVGQEFQLHKETNIGRDASGNDIVIDDPTVSGRHARIRLMEGQFVLFDLASSNGTFVNGQQTQKQPLQDWDVVRFGKAEFRFMEVAQS